MAFWDSLIGAVNNYFNPKPVSSNTVPWSQISSSLGNQPVNFSNVTNRGGTVSGSSSRVAPQGGYATKSQVSAINAPSGSQRGIDIPSGNYAGGGSTTQASLPPPFVPPPSPELKPINIQSAVSNLAKTIAPVIQQGMTTQISPVTQKFIGMTGSGLEQLGKFAGTLTGGRSARLGQGGESLGRELQTLGGVSGGITPEDIQRVISRVALDWISGVGDVSGQSLLQALRQRESQNLGSIPPVPPTSPKGTLDQLPGISTSQGQILPTAAKTGAPQTAAKGIMPSTTPTPRAGVVPSAISPAALPANMRNLSTTNVNPAVASAITPQAIQSIGQLLLQSLLGNQSGLTGITPGLAQALWGAPTSSSPFGGYEGGAAVPSQTSIEQPKNIPPLPQPLQQG